MCEKKKEKTISRSHVCPKTKKGGEKKNEEETIFEAM